MLTNLFVSNYALIDELSIDFSSGLSIITGETGAGKSILLGALGLVLGNRADLSTLKDTSKKCVVEAKLAIANYNLRDFFEEVDLDYDDNTIIRREISPSGKSRAFVNDTPVTLTVLNDLRLNLIDVHSQHQTLKLSDTNFQFSVIDALAKNASKIESYKRGLKTLQALEKELDVLTEKQREANQQYDYNLHLFNELSEANLEVDEQEELEEKLEKLNNIEDIKLNLSEVVEVSINDEVGVQNLLNTLEHRLSKIATFSKAYEELYSRINSLKIEFDDIVTELESEFENLEYDPNELEVLNNRLQLLYNLQKKHYVNSNVELLTILEELSQKIEVVENSEQEITAKENEIKVVKESLNALALKISKSRQLAIPQLQLQLENLLSDLGMQNSKFSIATTLTDNFYSNGKDKLSFLFSANKGGSYGELKKVASGGELSRIMLAVKKILAENTNLPTIIFDEIDIGVSGEISNKMASIMHQMSNYMQVITITHLPQIAAKGHSHYKVYKQDIEGVTSTNLKQLTAEERIVEIAEMLSGKDISETALTHAKQLLN
ncbi:MAG: DNA repair protein RecN [Flavobacteriaceae bacterium]|nr:DNA repair protein RecN [Flavobacteriaceae bacterium]